MMSSVVRRKMWNATFMTVAETIAEMSTCTRHKVGCVLTKDNYILSTGFNGSFHNQPHCDTINFNDKAEHDAWSAVNELHAETNAVLNANYKLPRNFTTYCTRFPCINCCRTLIAAGTIHIIYKETRSQDSTEETDNVRRLCLTNGVMLNHIDDVT